LTGDPCRRVDLKDDFETGRSSAMIDRDGHLLALQTPWEDRSMDETVRKTPSKTKSKAKAPSKPRKESSAINETPASLSKKRTATNGAPTNLREMKITHQQVAELAHRLWAERGGQHGHDADDWFRAEQALRGKAS
jgi:hypothetical protein